MINHSEERRDRALRATAQASLDQHLGSVQPDEIEMGLHAVRARTDSTTGRPRRVGLVAAAAAVIVLVGGLVVVANTTNDRATTDSPALPERGPAPLPSTSTTTPPATTPSTATATRINAAPATLLDVNGEPINESGAAGSAFHDVVVDHLLNHSDILGDTVEQRQRQLDTGGLQIHTTLDPAVQVAADAARTELPVNSRGFGAAVVSLDTRSGAVRALSGPVNDQGANMAMTPRQTGGAVGLFITAAAVDAGAHGDDVIDARRGCTLPTSNPDVPDFVIDGGIAGMVGTLHEVVQVNVACGLARLSLIVGLDRLVDMTYQMAASDYLHPTLQSPERPPLQPFASFATGANELSALDMASGIQTVANEGLHHDPYFVEYIDDAAGNRVYTHRTSNQLVLDPVGTLETIDILKGVFSQGTARRHYPLAGERPAFGITGTQADSTNAWFVGATKELSTAVWVGDPNAYTPMIDITEFVAEGVSAVQGGRYPTQIWKAFTDAALDGVPPTDWAPPPEPARGPVRLVLPGNECLPADTNADPSGLPQQIPPEQPLTTVDVNSDIVPCT